MPRLIHCLNAWKTDDFNRVLCDEISTLGPDALPLHKATSQGGLVENSSLSISVLSTAEDDRSIQVKIGIFFTEVVGGCNCADDPVTANAYCECQVIIDKPGAEADIQIIHN